jgi:diguanylate cyclase (GGDEF)-like protein
MALMYLDIDRFKSINDTHGHAGGDAVLKEFAARLTRGVRATDTVARLSGDEFAIVLEGLNVAEDAGQVAAKILVAMAPAFQVENRSVPVSTSIGISFSAGQGQDPEALIKQADAAMYKAKRSGRNNYQIYSAGDEKTATELSSAGKADAAKAVGI